MKKTLSLSSLFIFAHLFSAQQNMIESAIIVAMGEFPILDGTVEDNLVEEAA